MRLAINLPGPVGGEEFAKVFAGAATDAGAAMRQLVGPGPHFEIFFGIDVGAGFEQSAAEAALGEDLCGHSAAGAGADDADVVLLRRTRYLSHLEELSLKFIFLHCGDGEIARPSRERHVGKRGIHARSGNHASAVGHEKVLGIVRLIVGVEHGGFWIPAHAGGAHFVNGETGGRNFLPDGDVLRAAGGKNFCGLDGDVLGHGVFIFAPVAVNLQSGNAPGVEFFLVHFDEIVVIGEALAETAHAHVPGAGHFQRVLEFHAEAAHAHAAGPAGAASAALVAVAADKILVLGFNVSKARDVDAVGAIAERHFVFVAGHSTAGPGAHVVVHEIVAKFAPGVREAVGKFGRGGIQENARGFESGATDEKDARFEFERIFGLTVDHANAADAAGFRIIDEAVDHAVGPHGKTAGFLRGGKRRTQTAEIGAGDAAAVAHAAVVAGGAAFVDAGENRGPANRQDAVVKILRDGRPEILLDASEFHGREKFSVGELRQSFR